MLSFARMISMGSVKTQNVSTNISIDNKQAPDWSKKYLCSGKSYWKVPFHDMARDLSKMKSNNYFHGLVQ